jgi:hypothetical protein
VIFFNYHNEQVKKKYLIVLKEGGTGAGSAIYIISIQYAIEYKYVGIRENDK